MEYLKEGDVIEITSGMSVKATIPEKFIYSNRKLSNKTTKECITVDHIYRTDGKDFNSIIDNLTKNIIHEFEYEGYDVSYDEIKTLVLNKVKKPTNDKFVFEAGEFVVTKTKFGGGGTGMGDHDIYPDGHEVFCKRLIYGKYNELGDEISFYEDGCFNTTVKKKIIPIRRMEMVERSFK